VEAGISSFKIEGRIKSAYYAAVTANTYRMALDAYLADPAAYRYDPRWMEELCSVSHREYATGFYYTSPHLSANTVTQSGYIREKAYLATALEDGAPGEDVLFIQRNKYVAGEPLELITPGKIGQPFRAEEIRNEAGESLPSTPHPGMRFYIRAPFAVKRGDILRSGKEV